MYVPILRSYLIISDRPPLLIQSHFRTCALQKCVSAKIEYVQGAEINLHTLWYTKSVNTRQMKYFIFRDFYHKHD